MGSFRKGDRVFQAQYGAGDILAADDRYTIIEFDDGAVRKFVTRLLRLQPSGEPRPLKPAPQLRRQRKRRTEATAPAGTAHTS